METAERTTAREERNERNNISVVISNGVRKNTSRKIKNKKKEHDILNWSAKRMNMLSFRADQRCRVQRVNNNKKGCK